MPVRKWMRMSANTIQAIEVKNCEALRFLRVFLDYFSLNQPSNMQRVP
jgi:hypothetical protein